MDPTYLASFGSLEDRHWWFRARREIVADQLRLHVHGDIADLLDVGAGTGGALCHLREHFPDTRCRGVEPDTGARETCLQRHLDVIAGTADPLPFESASQDVVTALDVLEHLDDDISAALEIARVLRPGGIALVTVPAFAWLWGPHDTLNAHQRRYRRFEIEQTVTAAGLEVERASYFNTLLFPLAVVQRMAEKLIGKRGATEKVPPGPLNAAFYHVFRLEMALLRHMRLPWGVSIIVVARKPR
ncbi:MAG: class I SAM-dependent methyltransferase [Coriobacteriia bacterium]|nr:class I SAM-dependent methyltransferase [Coriobacteriia bacterium]